MTTTAQTDELPIQARDFLSRYGLDEDPYAAERLGDVLACAAEEDYWRGHNDGMAEVMKAEKDIAEETVAGLEEALRRLGRFMAAELGVPFPTHWRGLDHPVLEELEGFMADWRTECGL